MNSKRAGCGGGLKARVFVASGGATGGGDALSFSSGQSITRAPEVQAEEAAAYVTCDGGCGGE